LRSPVLWEQAASVSNPLAVTRAYVARFKALGGVVLTGDAMRLHQSAGRWRIDTAEGPVDAEAAVVALGPWAPDLLAPLGIRLPLGIKRGYHRHFRPRGNAGLARPILDAENGYASRRWSRASASPPAPNSRPAMPRRRRCSSIASCRRRPACSRSAIRSRSGRGWARVPSLPTLVRAPGQPGLWLAYGHGHSGMTLGPVTGRLIAEMLTGETPFCDPAPYRAERFG
jgi:D-amino-acid dehydrogenase